MIELITNKVPVLFVGAPGVGKTAIVQQGFDHAEIILTSTMVEEDIAGLPYREGEYDFRTVPALFRRLQKADSEGKTTVLFLDELDKARRSVADTLLTLIASRKVGETCLPERTCIVAAANPPEFGGGDGISDAMISRFSVIDFVPSVKGWSQWADKQFKSAPCKRVINEIREGKISLIECVGDGFEKRISSPRTIALTLSFLEDKGANEHFETVARGLLTANVASGVISAAKVIKDKTLDKSTSVKMRAYANAKSVKPMVL